MFLNWASRGCVLPDRQLDLLLLESTLRQVGISPTTRHLLHYGVDVSLRNGNERSFSHFAR
jgi:hypothetical protein